MEEISVNWRKSRAATCVEVGNALSGVVVRNSTDRKGAVMAVSAGAWRTLLAEVRERTESSGLV